MSNNDHKPLMRSLGEFVGHIVKAVRTNPAKTTVRKAVHEEDRGDVILRRTTIDEIEVKRPDSSPSDDVH